MNKTMFLLLCTTAISLAQPQWVFHQEKFCITPVKTIDSGFGFLVGGAHYQPYTPFMSAKITPLSNDLTFNTAYIGGGYLPAEPNTVSSVRAIVDSGYEEDRYYVAGNFYLYGGDDTTYNIVRIFGDDGVRDTSFFNTTQGVIYALGVQADKKLIIGGNFNAVGSVSKNRIARLNLDGTLDTTFDANCGFDGAIRAIAIQPDGKILVAGDFTAYIPLVSAPVNRYRIARLNSNGTLDTTFAGAYGFNSTVYDIELQNDGKILAGGDFTNWGNQSPSGSSERPTNRIKIARLNADGTIDLGFNPGAGFVEMDGVNNVAKVYTLSVYDSNTIFVGGEFLSYNGSTRNRLCMVNLPDATINTSFDAGVGPDDPVFGHTKETNGNIVIVGKFKTFNSVIVNGVKRISPTGASARTSGTETMPLEKAVASGFTVTPNPASNNVAISLPGGKIKGVTLNSIDGKQLYRNTVSELESVELDITPYENGILLLNVETSNGEVIPTKLIKK